MIRTKRVYDAPAPEDGARFLVERLWPRGMKKADVPMDDWLKDVAPSDALRRWFAHDPTKWETFQHRYFTELDSKPEVWSPLLNAAQQGTVSLLYSARDREHNNAVALQRYLESLLGTQSAQGGAGHSAS
jgi:uncharacterized protein YeaO (DUF488 family)